MPQRSHRNVRRSLMQGKDRNLPTIFQRNHQKLNNHNTPRSVHDAINKWNVSTAMSNWNGMYLDYLEQTISFAHHFQIHVDVDETSQICMPPLYLVCPKFLW
jgi:hypothetical protein